MPAVRQPTTPSSSRSAGAGAGIADLTIPGRFDDVRIYDSALELENLEAIRRHNLFEGPDGDFTDDGVYDCQEIDLLTMQIVSGAGDLLYLFDLTGDGIVDHSDLTAWLEEAGAMNLASEDPYLVGDANLDGIVDGHDFIEWNSHKFTNTARWCAGDFNADGVVDGQDLVLWNANKFMAADHVPEPNLPGTVSGCGRARREATGCLVSIRVTTS